MAKENLELFLSDEAACLDLGRIIGRELARLSAPRPALLLCGELGAGKTTFTRGLVSGLQGGEAAEVSSPSFNLVNLYPTTPACAHADLYRLSPAESYEVLEEYLDPDWPGITLVEWAERLAPQDAPQALRLTWRQLPKGRTIRLEAIGQGSELFERLTALLGTFSS